MDLMHSLLKEGMIRVKQSANDWKDAVKMGVGCLVGTGKADWSYYHSIVRSVAKNGPYFVLMPGVALPHARPEEGAISTGFSLVTLDTPVNFGSPENDPISILLSFCATDPIEQVEKAMVEAVSLFEDENKISKIAKATTIGEVEKILRGIEKKNKKTSLSKKWKNFWDQSVLHG